MTSEDSGTKGLRLITFGRLAVEPVDALVAGGPRPRRLALLAILATQGRRGLSRERVLAILWPESTDERGRHTLSQTLYALRQDLGCDAVRAGPLLTLDPALISSDVEDFHASFDARAWKRAAALYAGPFAEGFGLSDATGFEEWLGESRRRFAAEGHQAIEEVAREAEAGGDFRGSLPWRRRLAQAEPLSTRHAIGYAQALLGLGDRAGALEHLSAHAAMVRRELDADPDPALLALVGELRVHTRKDAPISPRPETATGSTAPSPTPEVRTRAPRPLLRMLGAVTVVLALSALGAWALAARRKPPARPVFAVGLLRDLATQDSIPLSGVLGDMLSTNLARASDIEILAPTRLLQALPAEPDPSGRALAAAAQRAGANEILEGEVTAVGDLLRLDLRRVDLRRGRLRRGYVVMAANRFALIDSATLAVTRDLQVRGPPTSVAEVTTRSPIAYRLYEEGLRALFQIDLYAAQRLFRSALLEDSTFALAAFYAWRTTEGSEKDSIGRIVRALAGRAPDRERLLMLAQMATSHSDLSALPMADTLLTRFASDPDALIAAGLARQHRFGFRPEIAALFERAFALDSVTGAAALQGGRIGDALNGLYHTYLLADSSVAAERTLRRWSAVQPGSAVPWFHLSHLMERTGRSREADAAYARNDELAVTPVNLVQVGIWKGINRGDPDLLLQSCRFGLSSARDEEQYSDYRWRCLLAYRHLGRLREALALTSARRVVTESGTSGAFFIAEEGINRLILDFTMGRPAIAGRGFLQAAGIEAAKSEWRGESARREAWWLTLAAMAFTRNGDTAVATGLVDSIQSMGERSLYGRDPLLHYYVRGTVLAAAQRHAEALVAFRNATYTWPLGFTRVNLEYARGAMALGRPRDAIGPLQAALRGGIEGPQLYVTRTELHELLARAFEASGMPDSARTHYRYVARMWADADPEFRHRHREAADWIRRNGGA